MTAERRESTAYGRTSAPPGVFLGDGGRAILAPAQAPIFTYAASVIAIGAALYHWLEGWNWLDSVYFVVITLTTIGYGEFAPTKPITKIITIFCGLNGIVLILMLFDVFRTRRGWDLTNSLTDDT